VLSAGLKCFLLSIFLFASLATVPVRRFIFAGIHLDGDWVVTGTESYYDEVFVLNGNLIVEDGGNLTLSKVTLKMNCTHTRQYIIEVKQGGIFCALDDSIITSFDPEKEYSFIVRQGSTFRMDNCALHHVGSGYDAKGLTIFSEDAVVENCLISYNTHGVVCGSGAVVRNNNMTRNDGGVVVEGGGINPSIYNNYISWNNGSGISIGDSTATIYNNTIASNSGAGINSHDNANPTIRNNVIKENQIGIFCVFNSSPTISDNMIAENLEQGIGCHLYSSPTIANNTITLNLGPMGGLHCTEYSDAVIQGNIITNNSRGIYCGLASPTIFNNTITSNLGGGIECSHSDAVIQGNIITNNTKGIACNENSNPIIQDNMILLNNGEGIVGADNCSLIIQGNNVASNGGHGIEIKHKSTGIIKGNKIINNSLDGIHSRDYSGLLIQGNIITSNGAPYEWAGVRCNEHVHAEIHWNDIYGNHAHDVSTHNHFEYDPSVSVNATYNYWRDGPDSEKISQNVLYNPWLTESIVFAEIMTPLSEETVSSTVKVSTDARAVNGITLVEFYLDGELKYADLDSPYEWDWDTTQYAETSHEIKVRLIDGFRLATEVSRTVLVDNTAPTVSIREPTPEKIYSGTISASANTTDNQEVVNVHVKVDETDWMPMTYNAVDLLWKYDFNTTVFSDGQHTLMVLALDKASNPATDVATIFTDNTPPTLTIQTPQTGITVGLTLTIDVQATDAIGISRIEFYLQDALVYTVTDTPYQWSWDTTHYPNGEYDITVKAYDIVGHVQTRNTTVVVHNVELPWWETHFWTIVQVLIGVGGLIVAILAYLTKTKEEKKKKK